MLGTAVNFAFSSAEGFTSTTFSGKILLQNAEYSKTSDEEQIRSGEGKLVTRHFYNPGEKATLEYIPCGTSISTAKSNTTLPDIGTLIDITACAEMPGLVHSTWVVVPEPKLVGSNTSAKKITLPLEYHSTITTTVT